MMNSKGQFQEQTLIGNEKGVAIIAALLILMLLSIIAITSFRTTTTEKAIVRSEAIFQRDFFLAESAAMEGIQKTANATTPDELLPKLITAGAENDGLIVDEIDPATVDPLVGTDATNLDTNKDGKVVGADDMRPSTLSPGTYRLVVLQDKSDGDSEKMGGTNLYAYLGYGLTETQGVKTLVKVGFKKRF